MSQAFVDHCLELLAPLGAVHARRMFGGHGLYADGLFVALIAFERLYVKVDEQSEAQFTAAGCEPFVYEGKGRPTRMSYWTVPAEAMESPALMHPWARLALQAAVRAAVKKASASAGRARTPGPTTRRSSAPKAGAKTGTTSRAAGPAADTPSKRRSGQAAPTGAGPRAPKARPRRARRCRPAVPGARRRPASGRWRGRRRVSA
ncbi:MAG: TfoX/Sxy family protein [Rubrivivax sp.]|nr:TfoX/Sxy family protein [Rubrivivax sp.]